MKTNMNSSGKPNRTIKPIKNMYKAQNSRYLFHLLTLTFLLLAGHTAMAQPGGGPGPGGSYYISGPTSVNQGST
ncbi:MAG: hypothetical protein AB3N18_00580, partial [Allomuricauda sp.]